MSKQVKQMILFAIILIIPLVGFFTCKALVDTEENPLEWTRNNPQVAFTNIYGSTAHRNSVASVLPLNEGGYILAGNITENRIDSASYKKYRVSNHKTVGGSDSWLVKTDAAGNQIWQRPIWGEKQDHVASLLPSPDGGYILAGYTDIGEENIEGWLVKTDSEGNQLWSQTYSGGGGMDAFNQVLQTRDGGYILAGWTVFADDERYNDGWVVKTDSAGKQIWSSNFGDSKSDIINSIQEASDGGYILAGQTKSPYNDSLDGWLVKLNADGQVLWSKTYGNSLEDIFLSICTDAEGNYIVAGQTQFDLDSGYNYDGWLVKVNPTGQEIWSKTYTASIGDLIDAVQLASDGGFILAGHTGSKDSSGWPIIEDAWVLKTDHTGQEVWSYTFGGDNPDAFTSVVETGDGGYILGGWSSSTKTGEPTGWILKLNGEGQPGQTT